jgi:F0F1-type ATP synthase assembly protein I
MWIVELALQSPYTFIIPAILLLLLGVITIVRTAAEISHTSTCGNSKGPSQPDHRVPRRSLQGPPSM